MEKDRDEKQKHQEAKIAEGEATLRCDHYVLEKKQRQTMAVTKTLHKQNPRETCNRKGRSEVKELEELAARTGTSDKEIGNEDIAGLIRPMATIFHKRQLYQANGQNM